LGTLSSEKFLILLSVNSVLAWLILIKCTIYMDSDYI
jgi:hypothetical protein